MLDMSYNTIAKVLTLFALSTLAFGASAQLATHATNTATISHPLDSDTSNNSATDSDTIVLVSDLSVSKTNMEDALMVGATTTYTIVARNLGPYPADGSVVTEDWTTSPGLHGLDCSAGPATCAASGGAACPAPPSVTPAALLAGVPLPVFPNGGVVTFTLQCVVIEKLP